MKKVAIVAQGLSNGGAERVASILANHFISKGYDTLFISVYNDDRQYFLDKRIKITNIKSRRKNKLFRLIDRNIKIYRELKKFGADTIFSFITNELIWSEIRGLSVIFSLRNDPNNVDNTFIASHLRQFAYKNAKHIVFQTQGAADYFSEQIRLKSSIIANPIQTSNFPFWFKHNHRKTFMTACRLNKQKNIPMLIRAFVEIHKQYPEYTLEVYGKGELKNELNDMIVQNDATSYIHLLGNVNNIHEKMSECAAFILPSDYEGLSNSMLEALAIGIPCICTDCPPGGAREFIKNEVNGLLTPVGDEKAMYDAIEKLILNPDMGYSFSKYSSRIRRDLDAKVICEKWERLI